MAERIEISRAAKEMGIPRRDLIKRLRNADVATFEGKVDVERLREVAPQWDLLESTAVADAARIQDAAMVMRRLGISRPAGKDPEVELQQATKRLLRAQGRTEHLEKVCRDLIKRLGEAQISDDGDRRDLAIELNEWLVARLKDW